MSNQNYIIEMLELKDNNINFYKNPEISFEFPFFIEN